ncbi:MAG TPA: cobalamin biosynthesis protein [Candidatus Binatia bacterium]|nr:cobalamin biosynthesis protein [Candidatus Binatia bacterium]
MTLIGIVLALLAERAFGHLPGVGEPRLMERVIVHVQRAVPLPRYWRSAFAPMVLLALALLAAAGVDWLLRGVALARLAFGSMVLFLCLGPRDLSEDVHRLLAARGAGDAAAAELLTRTLLRGPDSHVSKRSLIGALFIQSHERLFGVLLWFFAAGPAGAVLYRVASRMPRFLHETQPGTDAEDAAVSLHAAAAWIPARVTTLLIGMAGSLDHLLREWGLLRRTQRLPWRDSSWAVLADVGSSTIAVDASETGFAVPATLDACLREVLAVQQRALIILLAAFAMFTAGTFV